MRIAKLKYPPPTECPNCGKKLDLFATRAGWLCWSCVPQEDKADEFGIKYPEPEITKRDRRDLKEIRALLTGKILPKKLGRPRIVKTI